VKYKNVLQKLKFSKETFITAIVLFTFIISCSCLEIKGMSSSGSTGDTVPDGMNIDFTCNKSNIQPGEEVMLQWDVYGEGFFGIDLNGQPVDPTGQHAVYPVETSTYTLGVDIGSKVIHRELTVHVTGSNQNPQPQQPAPSFSSGCEGPPVFSNFDANPNTIKAGQSVALDWGPITNGPTGPLVGNVTITPGNYGNLGSPGSITVSPSSTTTYVLTATGCGGTSSISTTVTVTGSSGQPTPTQPPGGSSTGITLFNFLEEKNVQAAKWLDGPPATAALMWLGDMSAKDAEQKGYGYMRWLGGSFGNFYLEDMSTVGPQNNNHAVMMRPKKQYDGYISATYKMNNYSLGSNDYVIVRVGFMQGAGNGNVTFRINLTPVGSSTYTVSEINKKYDGKLQDYKIWLGGLPSYVVGKPIESFQIAVLAGNSADDDYAVWSRCELVRMSK